MIDSYPISCSSTEFWVCVVAYPEVGRRVLELIEWHRNSFNDGMTLLSETADCLVEQYTLVVFGVHLHETFHKVLTGQREPLGSFQT